jgi:hypothetical protein
VLSANHDGEHITAFPQRVVLPAGVAANNKKPGRHMAAPVFSFAFFVSLALI